LLVAGLYAAVTGGWEATFGKTMLGHHADRRGGVFLLIVGMALVVLGARLDRRAERRRDDSDRS
jgi:hypothetical protein